MSALVKCFSFDVQNKMKTIFSFTLTDSNSPLVKLPGLQIYHNLYAETEGWLSESAGLTDYAQHCCEWSYSTCRVELSTVSSGGATFQKGLAKT